MNSLRAAWILVFGSSLESSRGGSTLKEYTDLESMLKAFHFEIKPEPMSQSLLRRQSTKELDVSWQLSANTFR